MSIAARMTVIVAAAFLLTVAAVLVLADVHLTAIIDRSQTAVYQERLNAVMRLLERREARLEATGMRAAYEKAFREAAVRELRQAYGDDGDRFFFVLDAAGRPLVGAGPERTLERLVRRVSEHAEGLRRGGSFEYRCVKGRERWCVAREFLPWGWVVGYSVPFDLKYADVRAFRNRLLVTLTVILALVLGTLLPAINRIVRPIRELTEASRAMAAGDMDREVPAGGASELAALAGTFTDMRTAIREQMAELRRLRNYLRNIVDSMPSILVGVDPEGRVTQWNREAERRTGLAEAEAVGRRLDQVMPQLAAEMEKVRLAIRDRVPQRDSRVPQPAGDGAGGYADVTVYPLVANGVEGAVIRVDDITDRVRIEEMMIQTEKMMSVGGLAAGMAHEINNPLAGIMQNAQVLRMYLDPDSPRTAETAAACGVDPRGLRAFLEAREVDRITAAITEAAGRAARIVENMLSFSRTGDTGMRACDLARLTDRTIELAAKDYDLKKRYDFRKIRIVRDFEPGAAAWCDPGLIQQVLLNILRNGAQAMAQAGVADPCFTIRTRRGRDTVSLAVADNGPGMDEATRRRAFEPFFTTKEVGVGTGLGLSVSYFIVTEKHGGRIEVDSRPGRGAVFTITLPAAREDGHD